MPCHSLRFGLGLLTTALLLLISLPVGAATLIHGYNLDGSLADSLGGPSLVSNGGTLNPTNYSFAANQGLSLSSALPDSANYSIEMVFNFSDLSGFRKIVDFKNLTSDDGLYELSTTLNFFNITTGPAGAFVASTNARVVVTREGATKLFTGYVDGTPQISFTDSGDLAVFTGTSSIIQFFIDDFPTGQGEASAGVVDCIRIYNGPLSSTDVSGLTGCATPPTGGGGGGGVPEPSSLVLLGSGLIGLATAAWRRRRP